MPRALIDLEPCRRFRELDRPRTESRHEREQVLCVDGDTPGLIGAHRDVTRDRLRDVRSPERHARGRRLDHNTRERRHRRLTVGHLRARREVRQDLRARDRPPQARAFVFLRRHLDRCFLDLDRRCFRGSPRGPAILFRARRPRLRVHVGEEPVKERIRLALRHPKVIDGVRRARVALARRRPRRRQLHLAADDPARLFEGAEQSIGRRHAIDITGATVPRLA